MTTTTLITTVPEADQPLVRLNASDVMTSDVATVVTTTSVGEAMTLMRTLGIRHLPVIGDGRFAGIVDDRLIAFALLTAGGFGGALEQPVSTAMTHYVPQVGPGEPLQRVAHLLRTSRCDAIVVIDPQEHLLGIITMVDVVTAVALGDAGQPPATTPTSGAPLPAARLSTLPVAAAGARS
jgi:CBS domain-containing protein